MIVNIVSIILGQRHILEGKGYNGGIIVIYDVIFPPQKF